MVFGLKLKRTIVHGLIFGSPKMVLRNGYHWKEHLKLNKMAPSSEEL